MIIKDKRPIKRLLLNDRPSIEVGTLVSRIEPIRMIPGQKI